MFKTFHCNNVMRRDNRAIIALICSAVDAIGAYGDLDCTLKGSARPPTLRAAGGTPRQPYLAMTKSKIIAIRSSHARIIRTAPLRRMPAESTIGTTRTQRGPPPRLSHDCALQAAKFVRRDAFVLQHLKIAKAIAVRVHASLPVHVDLDDLVPGRHPGTDRRCEQV